MVLRMPHLSPAYTSRKLLVGVHHCRRLEKSKRERRGEHQRHSDALAAGAEFEAALIWPVALCKAGRIGWQRLLPFVRLVCTRLVKGGPFMYVANFGLLTSPNRADSRRDPR